MSLLVMCAACGEFRPAVEDETVRPIQDDCPHCGESDYRYLGED